jgi:hypothetical protein
MAFLDLGTGIGGTLEAKVRFGKVASIYGQARFVPLPLGGVRRAVEPEAERLAMNRTGDLVTYRQLSAGISHTFESALFEMGIGYQALELSGRRITELGHGAIMLQLDYSLPLMGR